MFRQFSKNVFYVDCLMSKNTFNHQQIRYQVRSDDTPIPPKFHDLVFSLHDLVLNIQIRPITMYWILIIHYITIKIYTV